jgi:hypothetical protein
VSDDGPLWHMPTMSDANALAFICIASSVIIDWKNAACEAWFAARYCPHVELSVSVADVFPLDEDEGAATGLVALPPELDEELAPHAVKDSAATNTKVAKPTARTRSSWLIHHLSP